MSGFIFPAPPPSDLCMLADRSVSVVIYRPCRRNFAIHTVQRETEGFHKENRQATISDLSITSRPRLCLPHATSP